MKKKAKEPELLTLTEAHKYLGISFTTLTKLLKKGVLTYETDLTDLRLKLVKRDDLEKLRKRPKKA